MALTVRIAFALILLPWYFLTGHGAIGQQRFGTLEECNLARNRAQAMIESYVYKTTAVKRVDPLCSYDPVQGLDFDLDAEVQSTQGGTP